MYPQLLAPLAAEHHRDLIAARRASAAAYSRHPARLRAARHLSVPKLRVSWTKTRLAAVSGRRRGSSLVIVISATRTS